MYQVSKQLLARVYNCWIQHHISFKEKKKEKEEEEEEKKGEEEEEDRRWGSIRSCLVGGTRLLKVCSPFYSNLAQFSLSIYYLIGMQTNDSILNKFKTETRIEMKL